MWRPKTVSKNRVMDKPQPCWDSSASENSVSSSTSSDSSVDTSDDELTMDKIRGDLTKDEKEDDMVDDPRPAKIQRVEKQQVGNIELME